MMQSFGVLFHMHDVTEESFWYEFKSDGSNSFQSTGFCRSPQIRPRPLPSKSVSNHYSPNILPFDCMQSEGVLTLSLHKTQRNISIDIDYKIWNKKLHRLLFNDCLSAKNISSIAERYKCYRLLLV